VHRFFEPPQNCGLVTSEGLAIKEIDTTRRLVAELRKRPELNGERVST
jgi:hypothetical protein